MLRNVRPVIASRWRERHILEVLEESVDDEGNVTESIIDAENVRDKQHAMDIAQTKRLLYVGRQVRTRLHICRHGKENRPCIIKDVEQSL